MKNTKTSDVHFIFASFAHISIKKHIFITRSITNARILDYYITHTNNLSGYQFTCNVEKKKTNK